MGRLRSKLRPGPIAVTVALFDLWKRLTPAQRRQVMAMARRHGPTVMAKASELRRKRR
ncbi:MAG TPA: hypothetical protein VGN06_07030 [Gaiellaceae bacterium]|jgi:hypothetical protein